MRGLSSASWQKRRRNRRRGRPIKPKQPHLIFSKERFRMIPTAWFRLAACVAALVLLSVAPLCAQEKVVVENDIEFANPDNQHLKVNMARPAQGNGPFPAILCIHG